MLLKCLCRSIIHEIRSRGASSKGADFFFVINFFAYLRSGLDWFQGVQSHRRIVRFCYQSVVPDLYDESNVNFDKFLVTAVFHASPLALNQVDSVSISRQYHNLNRAGPLYRPSTWNPLQRLCRPKLVCTETKPSVCSYYDFSIFVKLRPAIAGHELNACIKVCIAGQHMRSPLRIVFDKPMMIPERQRKESNSNAECLCRARWWVGRKWPRRRRILDGVITGR